MPGRPTVTVRFSASEIAARVDVMAGELAGKLPADTLVVSVLKGSFVFAADLIRALSRAGADWSMDFLTLSSYGTKTETSGRVKVVRDIVDDVRQREVLLVDDILESGLTLSFAKKLLLERGAKHVSICTLLDKPGKRLDPARSRFRRLPVRRRVPGRLRTGLGAPLPRPALHRGGGKDGGVNADTSGSDQSPAQERSPSWQFSSRSRSLVR